MEQKLVKISYIRWRDVGLCNTVSAYWIDTKIFPGNQLINWRRLGLFPHISEWCLGCLIDYLDLQRNHLLTAFETLKGAKGSNYSFVRRCFLFRRIYWVLYGTWLDSLTQGKPRMPRVIKEITSRASHDFLKRHSPGIEFIAFGDHRKRLILPSGVRGD